MSNLTGRSRSLWVVLSGYDLPNKYISKDVYLLTIMRVWTFFATLCTVSFTTALYYLDHGLLDFLA